MAPNTRTFLYHAHGVALGGVIRRPFEYVLESQAATSLPISGGYGSSRVSNFKFRELISFKEAYTQVSGSQSAKDGSYNTLVTTTVEGLNIADMITADRIVARISTQHGEGDEETRVLPVGSEFVGLRVAGHSVDVELDTALFAECDTLAKFKRRYQAETEFAKTMRARFLWDDVDKNAPEILKQRYKWQTNSEALPESKGILPCSLVKAIHCDCPETKMYGNTLVIPQFGIVYLAELYMEQSSRRLTMMRLEMGSPMEGTLTISGGEGNGLPFP